MDTLVDDIMNLINVRETALRSELERLQEFKQTVQPRGAGAAPPALAIEMAHDAAPRVRRRHMSAANRLAASKRMKAVWAAKRKKN